MKTLLLLFVFLTVPVVATAALPLKPLLSCAMVDGSKVVLLGKSHGLNGQSLYVQHKGKTASAFQDMPGVRFVGEIVLAKCIDNVMIFALNYGPPYLKGAAIRINPLTQVQERLYFAEKALARWLYTSEVEMLVIIPNIGFESDKKYIIYSYAAEGKGKGKGKAQQRTADVLPAAKSYKVSSIAASQGR